jgi:adenylate kinase family enzyme
MNLVILGPQGSGKGTQAELLAKKCGFNYIEMGNILRSISDSKNKWAGVIR